MSKLVNKEEPIITFRGWAGHLCVARSCLFRLNTLIEYKKEKIVVSTVGNYMLMGELTEVGAGRLFETMAFMAVEENGFWEANVSKQISFDSRWSYNEELEANRGHYVVIKELCNKLKDERASLWEPEEEIDFMGDKW